MRRGRWGATLNVVSGETGLRRVGVLCVGRGVHPRDLRFATELGTRLAERGTGLVCGGVTSPMVGELVRACVFAGGQVMAVVPHDLLAERMVCPGGLLHVVRTDSDRTRLIHRSSDGFLVLPGGLDVLTELGGVAALGRAVLPVKPIVIANLGRYFDPLLAMLDQAVAEEFMTRSERRRIRTADTVDDVLRELTMPVPTFAARAGGGDAHSLRRSTDGHVDTRPA
jgi:uncharacterized protein (TIGR00730 family)